MEAYDDPQLKARGMIRRSTHPEAGAIDTIQPPLGFTESSEVEALAPTQRIGADTDAILKSLGLDERNIAELRGNGTI
jgi:crotonobetainyl-CoA:carnitine CoA-transferase CaiB-like acyl-CoA transferase